jgi:UDP-GlcNAc:undecaprenyl-phosphate/decaprenyl-phosphate GlcNAc-1-phosphate transferase
MKSVLLTTVLVAAVAGLVTNFLVPFVIRLATWLQALDRPSERKLQAAAVPRLGGIAIFAGIALAGGAVAGVEWNHWRAEIGRAELVTFALATFVVFLLGVVDDLVSVSVGKKFLVELAAAYLLVRLGWSFQVLYLPGLGNVELGVFGEVVSLLWIVGVTNAINLIDGLDGLASGLVAIIAGGLSIHAVLQGNLLSVILMGAIAGSCLGFLGHNWVPARIFMGDSGSLTLGFLLAATSVHSSLKAPAAVAILVPMLVLGLPVMDTLVVMAARFLRRPHGHLGDRLLGMFDADRNHVHHKLEQVGAHRARIVVTLYGAALAFCAMALAVAATHNARLGLLLVAVEILAVLALRNFGQMRNGGRMRNGGEGGEVSGGGEVVRLHGEGGGAKAAAGGRTGRRRTGAP